jgi:hypothetical protein
MGNQNLEEFHLKLAELVTKVEIKFFLLWNTIFIYLLLVWWSEKRKLCSSTRIYVAQIRAWCNWKRQLEMSISMFLICLLNFATINLNFTAAISHTFYLVIWSICCHLLNLTAVFDVIECE